MALDFPYGEIVRKGKDLFMLRGQPTGNKMKVIFFFTGSSHSNFIPPVAAFSVLRNAIADGKIIKCRLWPGYRIQYG